MCKKGYPHFWVYEMSIIFSCFGVLNLYVKILLCLLCIAPLLATAQIKSIAFNAKGFHLKVDVSKPSSDIDKFLGISPDFSYKMIPEKTKVERDGKQHFTLQQYYGEYPVENAVIKLHFENDGIVLYKWRLFECGTISSISGNWNKRGFRSNY